MCSVLYSAMPWYRHLLWPFALLYGVGVGFRNLLFTFKILPVWKFEVPVICVGSMEMGGTGKSQLVHYIVKLLLENGKNVAVISRGYGRSTSGFRMVEEDSTAKEVGDEPLQVKRRFPNVLVAVCENRVYGIEQLLDFTPEPDFVVMDDGFQHRSIKPKLSILVTKGSFPFVRNFLFPVGTLREPVFGAFRANAVVFTGLTDEEKTSQLIIDEFILSKTVSSDPVHISGAELIDGFPDAAVLFSGIANADRFETTMSSKTNVLAHVKFRDHRNYTLKDIRMLRKKIDSFGASAKAVYTTEKDAVRLINTPLLKEFGDIPVYYIPVELVFMYESKAKFDKLIL